MKTFISSVLLWMAKYGKTNKGGYITKIYARIYLLLTNIDMLNIFNDLNVSALMEKTEV